jgi:hypothetical protein
VGAMPHLVIALKIQILAWTFHFSYHHPYYTE